MSEGAQDRRSKRHELASRIREQQARIAATKARIRQNGQEFRDRHLERRSEILGRLQETADRLEANARRIEIGEAAPTTALQRAGTPMQLEIRDPDRSSFRNGLAVGLGVVAIVGVAGVIYYLVSRKKEGGGTQIVAIPQFQPAPPIAGVLAAPPTEVISPPQQPRFGTVLMKSFNLPSINDKTRPAVRVANATDVPYDVTLRTVGPPGQFAYFSYNAAELNNFRGGTPIGDTLILATGATQSIPLKPREALYAKGSQANVVISVTSNEAMTRIV